MGHAVAQLAQFKGKLAHALGRPQQRLLGVAPGIGLHQPLEILQQLRIALGDRPATGALAPHPTGTDHLPTLEPRNPARIVFSAIPLARATATIPPYPSERASAAAHRRR